MRRQLLICCASFVATLTFGLAAARADNGPLTISAVASTVPANGDINPYGVARVPVSMGNLQAGNILVSNFNNSNNFQGTGSTIVEISPAGAVSLFAQLDPATLPGPCPGGVGLTTALVALRSGWVIVGSLPTSDGTAATAQAGCLIVLDSTGTPVETISGGPINGPWDMTALDADGAGAVLFVSNVLNGTVAGNGQVVNQGTVVRIVLKTFGQPMPKVMSMTVIGSGFPERTDPAALVIGPTGLGLDQNGVLFVADSLDNRVAAIANAVGRQSSAGMGTTVTQNGTLNDPLGLAVGGDLVATVNGDDGFLVVTSQDGQQIFKKLLDSSGSPPGSGALFGLAFAPQGLFFVDDATNMLMLLHGGQQ